MGMFDYIKIDQILLPCIGNIKSDLFENEFWQTKSLYNCLSTFTIKKDGLLEETLTKESIKIDDFHGIISFYTDVDDIWFQFDAKFTEGKLISVTESVAEDYTSRKNSFHSKK
jgi:hypothetical protein